MAHGDYYDPTDKVVYTGDVAQADDLNAINTDVDSALAQVAIDLDTLEASQSDLADEAEAWATDPQGTNPDLLQPTKYSSFANAEEAKAWASGTGGVDTEADGSTVIPYSANEKAIEAATSASNAATSETNASTSASNASTSETNAATSASNAATSETNAATSASNAATSETNALASENKAHDWAEEAEDVEVDPGEYSAHHWAIKAAASLSSKEDYLGLPSTDGQVLSSTTGGVRSWVDSYSGLNKVPVSGPGSATAVAGNAYWVSTVGGTYTLTLPASPSDGDEVAVVDTAQNFGTNAVTIGRNGNNIMGVADDLTLDIDGTSLVLQYNAGNTNWVITKCTPVV